MRRRTRNLLLIGGALLLLASTAGATVHPMMSLAELRALAVQVGFPDPDLAAAVAMAESDGKIGAIGDNGTSIGLWQIHYTVHREFDPDQLKDRMYNARAALLISRSGTNWHPWSTYNSGAYKRWLPAGRLA